jgi:hypothetical protein
VSEKKWELSGGTGEVPLAPSSWWSDLDSDLLKFSADSLWVDVVAVSEPGEGVAGCVDLGRFPHLDVGHLPFGRPAWNLVSFEVIEDGCSVDLPGAGELSYGLALDVVGNEAEDLIWIESSLVLNPGLDSFCGNPVTCCGILGRRKPVTRSIRVQEPSG